MVWFMDINLTDNRTTVGSYDNRSSGGVFLIPKVQHMRGEAPIQPHANALLCAKPERFGTEDADRETGGGICGLAEMQREPASDRNVTSYPGDGSLRRSYPGDEGDIHTKLQIGAGERRTVPAGHGFKTTATIDVAIDDG